MLPVAVCVTHSSTEVGYRPKYWRVLTTGVGVTGLGTVVWATSPRTGVYLLPLGTVGVYVFTEHISGQVSYQSE